VLTIELDQDVTFCPCFLKLKLGNLEQASLQELWNAEPLVAIRRAFQDGRLPEACRGQLCAPALGQQSYLTEAPAAATTKP
jgi:iron-sulfur cluster protein